MKSMDWSAVLDSALASNRTEGNSKIGLQSPAAEWLELPSLQSWEAGRVEAVWPLDVRALNSRGQLFGGYYGVLADSLLALAAMTVLTNEEHFKTSDLRLSFFRPVSEGDLRLTAEVLNRSRSMVHVEGFFYDANDRLLAKSSAVQAIVPIS